MSIPIQSGRSGALQPDSRQIRWASRLRDSQHDRDGAVIADILVSHAPVEVIVAGRSIHGLLVLVAIAGALAAAGLPAAVVVGNDVVTGIHRVVTRADPGDGRGRRASRTGMG